MPDSGELGPFSGFTFSGPTEGSSPSYSSRIHRLGAEDSCGTCGAPSLRCPYRRAPSESLLVCSAQVGSEVAQSAGTSATAVRVARRME